MVEFIIETVIMTEANAFLEHTHIYMFKKESAFSPMWLTGDEMQLQVQFSHYYT